ncbi:MAG: MBL fold metallo-hydrolase [Acidobacteria bacterium]|nr:MBL fold metallo-hydrolase [Acidobacteriota bacterium]
MDGISVPAEQIVAMDDIAADVLGLRIVFVNVFAITHADGSWTLVDAGLPFTASHIRNWAERYFVRKPNGIVLTHGHFDHVSAAEELAIHWGVPIYAHPKEFPYLTGEKEYPAPNVGAGGMMSLLSPLYPKGPVNIAEHLRAIPADSDQLDVMRGWTVIHTPGHTPGHVSFFRESDGILIVGDAFCTTKPESFFEAALAQQPELHGPPAYFTSDWEAACASVQRLAQLSVRTVVPGHGKPISGFHVQEELKALASRFVDLAVPENRKDQMHHAAKNAI